MLVNKQPEFRKLQLMSEFGKVLLFVGLCVKVQGEVFK